MTRRARPRLTWTDSEGTKVVSLERKTLVGSSSRVHASVADRSVSRLHAEFEVREDGVWVRDLGSMNGTWVGGVFVSSARVSDGAALRLGGVQFLVEYTEPEKIPLWPTDHFGEIHGRSEPMRELFFRISQCTTGHAPILLVGETGTGKELIAREIHAASDRQDGAFVVVDCAGLQEAWLERELFGEARTGDRPGQAGIFESAEGGTAFLDEISELPLTVQAKLLRVVESRVVRRPGDSTDRHVDIRLICSTNRDLQSMVSGRAFREDLYFRLAVLLLEVPALRDRKEDAVFLLDRFLSDLASPIEEETRRSVLEHRWLGNVRELRNFAERIRSMGEIVARATLEGREPPPSTRASPLDVVGVARRLALPAPSLDRPFKEVREAWGDHLEREYIGGMLRLHGRNVGAIAEAAGLDRTYVHRLIRKHDL
jgi:DNA-binding NtrC family response regulator